MVEENLEILNDNYPYALILYTMKLQEPDFIIANLLLKKIHFQKKIILILYLK